MFTVCACCLSADDVQLRNKLLEDKWKCYGGAKKELMSFDKEARLLCFCGIQHVTLLLSLQRNCSCTGFCNVQADANHRSCATS